MWGGSASGKGNQSIPLLELVNHQYGCGVGLLGLSAECLNAKFALLVQLQVAFGQDTLSFAFENVRDP